MKVSTSHHFSKISFFSLFFLLAQLTTGCGGKSSTEEVTTVTGQFIDAAVGGLSYTCSSGTSGITNQKGEYTCNKGDTVTFSINGFILGSAVAAGVITPITLSENNSEIATNIAQLLQTLDTDNDPLNGISIAQTGSQYDALATMANGSLTLSQSDFDTVVATYINETLVDEATAQNHLDNSISNLTFDKTSIQNALAGKTVYPPVDSPAYRESWIVATDGLSATGSGINEDGPFSDNVTISYTDSSFTVTSLNSGQNPLTFEVISISDHYIETSLGKIYYTQNEAYTDAIINVFAGNEVFPQQSSSAYSAKWAFDNAGTSAVISGVDGNGSYTDHVIVTYSGTTFTVTNQDIGDSDYGIPSTFTVTSISGNTIHFTDSTNVEHVMFYSAETAASTVVGVSITPSNSVTLSKDLGTTSTSFLPELLGSNNVNVYLGDGSNKTLNCLMHHYNSVLNEHVLHCQSEDATDFYFGMSSSDASIIAFQTDGIGSTYWVPLKAGTAVITGKLLFSDIAVSFNVNVTLTSSI